MTKREASETDFYHVVTVGIGHQTIFEDDDDRRNFYRLMERVGDEERVEFHAWCFMDNHVHLVVRSSLESLAKFMHRVERIYAEGFNDKYCRNGPLFRRPYWSEPILTDEQMMATVRYVHRNPLKPRLARTCADYRWSSYNEYTRTARNRIVRTDFILEMFGGRRMFEEFHGKCGEKDKFLDVDNIRLRRTSEEALAYAHELFGPESLSNIAALPKPDRDEKLRMVKEHGLTINQLAWITGIGKSIIARA